MQDISKLRSSSEERHYMPFFLRYKGAFRYPASFDCVLGICEILNCMHVYLYSFSHKFLIDGADGFLEILVPHPDDDVKLGGALVDHLDVDICFCQRRE